MQTCSRCGTVVNPGQRFCIGCGAPAGSAATNAGGTAVTDKCSSCGATLTPGAAFCTGCGARAPQGQPISSGGSLVESFQKLGFRLGKRELIGMGVSLLVGIIVSRLWPYIFPAFAPMTYPITNALQPIMTRETFNSSAMTLLTFLSSFVVSFGVALMSKRRQPR